VTGGFRSRNLRDPSFIMTIADTFVGLRTAADQASGSPRWTRLAAAGLTLLLAFAALVAFAASVQDWTPAAVVALPLVLASAAWISGGTATSILGLFQPEPDGRSHPLPQPLGRTALVVTLCNEDAAPLAAYLNSLLPSLEKAGLGETTRVFVLSDSFRPESIAGEEAALAHLLEDGRIVYRRRARNTGHKPGNIADWLETHGADHDYMLVLDADSRMTGGRIARMIREMEARPDLGLLQAGIALVPGRSRFGRHQRLSARLLTPNFIRGFAALTGASGNYWGHNALIRTAAFRCAARLPELPGAAPLGGPILSHDFVEAAWIRRAGWAVALDPDLRGSAEDGPQTVEEFHRRDRRWCQGNLQHLRLLSEPGLDPVSRLHLASGAFSYLAAPIWLALIVLIASGAVAVDGALPLAVVAVLLLVPKLCAMPRRLGRARTLRRRARLLRASLVELVVSTLLAPLVMLRQSRSVAAVLCGRDCGWKSARPTLRLPRGVIEAAAGAAIAALALSSEPAAALWLIPLVLPLLAAPLLLRWLDAQP
jgi:membrane glycosyltransferase